MYSLESKFPNTTNNESTLFPSPSERVKERFPPPILHLPLIKFKQYPFHHIEKLIYEWVSAEAFVLVDGQVVAVVVGQYGGG